MDDQADFRRCFRRELAAIPEAARWLDAVAEKAGLPEKVVFEMQVCLEELFSNIVRHGKPVDPARSDIGIGIEAGTGRFRMTFEDEGESFDLTKASIPPLAPSLEEVRPGGLGIRLIRSFSKNVRWGRTGDRNQVTLDFSP